MEIDGATIRNPVPTAILPLKSTENGQQYRLFISIPENYQESGQQYPVLFVLDGNGLYPLVRQIVELFTIVSAVPDLIIVGIGYPVPTYMDTLQLRGRDFTYELFTPADDDSYPWGATGGGEQFLKVIAGEIIPLIEDKYRIDSQNRSLLGFSLGAEFAHRAIYLYPGLFSKAILIDGFDNQADELALLPDRAAPVERLFIGYSSGLAGDERSKTLATHIEAISTSGTQAKLHIFQGENHFSVLPGAISRGLREVYAAP